MSLDNNMAECIGIVKIKNSAKKTLIVAYTIPSKAAKVPGEEILSNGVSTIQSGACDNSSFFSITDYKNPRLKLLLFISYIYGY